MSGPTWLPPKLAGGSPQPPRTVPTGPLETNGNPPPMCPGGADLGGSTKVIVPLFFQVPRPLGPPIHATQKSPGLDGLDTPCK